MSSDEELQIKIVRKLARSRVVGGHKKQVETVKNWVATNDQGRAETLVREMIRDPAAPLEGYGGSRDNVRLTSIEDAKTYIRDRGGDLPWGLRE